MLDPATVLDQVTAYVAACGLSADETTVTVALGAEIAAQERRCRIPAETYPADLLEALCRRVAHNIAVRALPLGAQEVSIDGGAVGGGLAGMDAEAARLEAPYWKVTVG